MLVECQILLSLQEMDLEVRVAKLAEEQACGLHNFDGWDLSVVLEELRARVAGVEVEHTTKVRELSKLVVEISNALVNLEMRPIWDIPQLLNTAREGLALAGLILERL
jgi:hypothetical protein